MPPEDDLISSPLEQTYAHAGHEVEIRIYRMPDSPWTLEVCDVHGNSTVWDDTFATDRAALDEFFRTVREEGIETLISERARPSPSEIAARQLRLAAPLAEAEQVELERFLISDATSDETMVFSALDGYLTAILVGPTTLTMSQWYPGIWGDKEDDAPHFETAEQAQHIMDLIMRHYNGIVWSLLHDPDAFEPLFDYVTFPDDAREYLDGEAWAYGFMQGLELCRRDWAPLFADPRGPEWLTPIRLLGADVSEEDSALVRTPEQREAIAARIPTSVAAIYRFWLPHHQAGSEAEVAKPYRRDQPKVGRNDTCACGSGKKFKKCCGKGGTLH